MFFFFFFLVWRFEEIWSLRQDNYFEVKLSDNVNSNLDEIHQCLYFISKTRLTVLFTKAKLMSVKTEFLTCLLSVGFLPRLRCGAYSRQFMDTWVESAVWAQLFTPWLLQAQHFGCQICSVLNVAIATTTWRIHWNWILESDHERSLKRSLMNMQHSEIRIQAWGGLN